VSSTRLPARPATPTSTRKAAGAEGDPARRGARQGAHADLATVVPVFNVESVERPRDVLDRHSRRRVEFESIDFNERFIATVPRDHDRSRCGAVQPRFIDWTTQIPAEVDFGITDQQLFFHWRLRERSAEELATPSARGRDLRPAAPEMEENNLDIYKAGPWNAG
jgi:hypothetical protein